MNGRDILRATAVTRGVERIPKNDSLVSLRTSYAELWNGGVN